MKHIIQKVVPLLLATGASYSYYNYSKNKPLLVSQIKPELDRAISHSDVFDPSALNPLAPTVLDPAIVVPEASDPASPLFFFLFPIPSLFMRAKKIEQSKPTVDTEKKSFQAPTQTAPVVAKWKPAPPTSVKPTSFSAAPARAAPSGRR